MLNKEQFEEIKEALADYRFRRGLFYENQRKGFLGNIFEEISEYLCGAASQRADLTSGRRRRARTQSRVLLPLF